MIKMGLGNPNIVIIFFFWCGVIAKSDFPYNLLSLNLFLQYHIVEDIVCPHLVVHLLPMALKVATQEVIFICSYFIIIIHTMCYMNMSHILIPYNQHLLNYFNINRLLSGILCKKPDTGILFQILPYPFGRSSPLECLSHQIEKNLDRKMC